MYSSESFATLRSSLSDRIFWAAQRGADAELREVLKAVPREEVHWLDKQHDTALWVAVANDRVTTATLLLDAKACVYALKRRYPSWGDPLRLAALLARSARKGLAKSRIGGTRNMMLFARSFSTQCV